MGHTSGRLALRKTYRVATRNSMASPACATHRWRNRHALGTVPIEAVLRRTLITREFPAMGSALESPLDGS